MESKSTVLSLDDFLTQQTTSPDTKAMELAYKTSCEDAGRAKRDMAINEGWNTVWGCLFEAYLKFSRFVVERSTPVGVTLFVHRQMAVREIPDIIAYLARAYSDPSCRQQEKPDNYGLHKALNMATAIITKTSAASQMVGDQCILPGWDEPAQAVVQAFSSLRQQITITGAGTDEGSTSVTLNEKYVLDAIPMMIARLSRAYALLSKAEDVVETAKTVTP
jgi:hypothetical protein